MTTAGGITTALGLLVDGAGNVVVEPTATTQPVPAPDSAVLPATGSDVNSIPVLLAVVMVALGAALATRRRWNRNN